MKVSTAVKVAGGAVGVAAGAIVAWTALDALTNRGVERVPYTVVGRVNDVEFRRYPETLRVRTTARSEGAAFGRLFRYISGENAGGESVSMTAPVETGEYGERSGDRAGEPIAMTAPVETAAGESVGSVTMSFYLPEEYTPETAPEPMDADVELVVDPPRTLAVRSFSWWTPGVRVRRLEDRLLRALADVGVETVGEPVLERYDPPFAPPFRRTNEIAVEVTTESVRDALRNA